MQKLASALGIVSTLVATGCALNPANPGVPGSSEVTHPAVDGTVFTIIFENHEKSEVIRPQTPTFWDLAQEYATADAYITNLHPSLLNYIVMTSGDTNGITANVPPSQQSTDVAENLGEQLDAAGIKWRAYMEDMGEPCSEALNGDYVPHHNPFIYYTSLTDDAERCKERVVDFDEHFEEDLAKDEYKYMWITPNMCNNMHNCGADVADAWLDEVVGKIMDSPGYKKGGAIFVMFDEGSVRILGASADLPTIVVSDQLAEPGYATDTRFDHRSYLATVEDIFGLPRLPTTKDATPMNEMFQLRTDSAAPTP